MGGQVNSQHLRHAARSGRGVNADGQHYHVIRFLLKLAGFVQPPQDNLFGGRIFSQARNAGADVIDPVQRTRALVVRLIVFAVGALIHQENAAVYICSDALLGQDRFLGCVHAANAGTPGMLLLAGTDALQPGDLLRRLASPRRDELAVQRAVVADQALEFQACQHARKARVTIFLILVGVEKLVPGREHDGGDMQRLFLGDGFQIDRVGRTGLDTFPARLAVVDLLPQRVAIRNGASGALVDQLLWGQSLVVFAGDVDGADFGALSAVDAPGRVDVCWPLHHLYAEVAGLSFDFGHFCARQNCDIRVAALLM